MDQLPQTSKEYRTGTWLVLSAAVLWGTTGTAQALAPESASIRLSLAKSLLIAGQKDAAKKELEELFAAGVVENVVNIGKPAGLMARIVALFTDEDDLVVDVGSPTAEMASVACQLRRRVVYVELPGTDGDRPAIRLPRLRAAACGAHPIPDGVLFFESEGEVPEEGYYVGRRPRDRQESGDVCMFKLGKPLLNAAPPVIDYVEYAAGSPEFLQALASVEGLVWMQGSDGEFARSHDERVIALHFTGDHVFDGRSLVELSSRYDAHLAQPGNRLRIYYHRGAAELSPTAAGKIELRHVPFELAVAAGAWA